MNNLINDIVFSICDSGFFKFWTYIRQVHKIGEIRLLKHAMLRGGGGKEGTGGPLAIHACHSCDFFLPLPPPPEGPKYTKKGPPFFPPPHIQSRNQWIWLFSREKNILPWCHCYLIYSHAPHKVVVICGWKKITDKTESNASFKGWPRGGKISESFLSVESGVKKVKTL